MRPARRPLWAAAALLLCAAARGPAGRASAARRGDDTPKITVQALPRFEELRCVQSAGQLEVQARLVDDVGAPLSSAPIELTRGGTPVQAVACGGRLARARALETDAAGRLCARLSEARAAGSLLTLSFRGDTLHLPVQAELALEPEAAGKLQLAFEAASLELNLDQPEQRSSLQLSGEGAAADALPAITVQLEEGGSVRNVATHGWLRSGSSLSFSVDSDELGSPGPARLLARVKGSTRPDEIAEAVALRTASVQLELLSVTPNADGVEVRVRAQSRAGVPSGGWVDLSRDGESLASGPLSAGVAGVQLPSAAGLSGLQARYHSDDPWWQPGEALPIELDNPGAKGPARWPWLVLLAPVGYVCVRALQRPGLREPRRAARRPRPRTPTAASPSLPEPLPPGWSGTLLDAHDGHPIAGARVTASLPSLRDEERGSSVISDARGRFALPPLPEPIPEGALLLVSAPLHADFQRALPPQGRVEITLTSRRRALLGRLVRWARAAGPPWHRGAEPTPAEIAIVALRRGETDTARWAEGVQAAAFDRSDVDREREAEVRAAEPAWQNAAHFERAPTDRSS